MSKDEEDDAPQEVEKQADSSSGAAYWRVIMALPAPCCYKQPAAARLEVKRLGGPCCTRVPSAVCTYCIVELAQGYLPSWGCMGFASAKGVCDVCKEPILGLKQSLQEQVDI